MSVTLRSRVLVALALLAGISLPARAQRPARQTPPPVPLPVVVADAEFDVVLLTHASAAALGDAARMSEYFSACRRRLAIPASDSLAVIRSRTWDWTSGAAADDGTLTFLVSRATSNEVDCLSREGSRATAFARGLRVTSDTIYPYGAGITAVTAHRGERLVGGDALERIPATRMTQRGLLTISDGIVRLTVPIDSLAPLADGRVSDLELAITTADTTIAHRIAIPWSAVRPMWEQVLRARSARLADTAADANRALLTRLDSPAIGESDALDARVQVGLNFAEAGDSAGARVILGRAVSQEPCLTLGASAPSLARDIVGAVHRPAGRCRASMGLSVAQAAVVPGLAQLRDPKRRILGALVLGAVISSLVRSQSANDEAKQLYEDYRAVDGPDPQLNAALAARLYDQAESRRLDGSRLVLFGATVWGASIAEAGWSEYRLARRLARVQGYAPRARALSLAPSGATGRIGLALNFF